MDCISVCGDSGSFVQTLSARLLIPRLLSGLFSWLQLVNDATLILESSSVTVSTAEAERGTVAYGKAKNSTTTGANLGFDVMLASYIGCVLSQGHNLPWGQTDVLSDAARNGVCNR